LYALCHVDHLRSARVLERGGFVLETVLRRHAVFPNLPETGQQDVLCYSKIRRGDVKSSDREKNAQR
jgi:RimJ/RimL family protein N-acetyltransferase